MKKLLLLLLLVTSLRAYSVTIGPFIELATKLASIVDQKEKTKYVDKILEIKEELHNEELKKIPDDGHISNLYAELMRIYTVLGNPTASKTP